VKIRNAVYPLNRMVFSIVVYLALAIPGESSSPVRTMSVHYKNTDHGDIHIIYNNLKIPVRVELLRKSSWLEISSLACIVY
jgi:hypothetical protein